MKWLKRITEYYRDKVFADKCKMSIKDICVHERDGNTYMTFEPYNFPEKNKCVKCGEFYQ